MEKFQELRDAARKKLQLADYILTMAYPSVKDPHLLLSSVESLFLAFSYGMGSILYYDLAFKRIPQFPGSFAPKFELFRDKCAKRHNIPEEHLKIMKELREIIVAHKKSPVEFSRKGNFVICTNGYSMMAISSNEVKGYIEKAKLFIKDVTTIVSKDEAIFS